VLAAADGHEALERFGGALDAAEPFDLVCLDIRMPGMDGQQALRAIRRLEMERGTPIGGEVKALMISSPVWSASCPGLGFPKNTSEFHWQRNNLL